MGVTSFILGMICFIGAILLANTAIKVLLLLLGLISLIFGIISICTAKRRGLGITGVVLSFITMLMVFWNIGAQDSKSVNNVNTVKAEVVEDEENTELVTNKTQEESATIGQLNAIKKAKLYLATMPFSYTGLIKQLEFEGFSEEEATYGASHCGADWNEQAEKKAKLYLQTMPFSRDKLINQLEFDGFTNEQAQYGVSAVGY